MTWHMTIDAASQKPFYYNSATKETSWTEPPGFQSAATPPPPPAQPSQEESNPIQASINYATPVEATPVEENPWKQTQVQNIGEK